VEEHLELLLRKGARSPSGAPDALFASFIPSVVGPEHKAGAFRSVYLDDSLPAGALRSPRNRARRDVCRLRFDLRKLWNLWNDSQKASANGKVTAFHEYAAEKEKTYAETASRWARAVTNRQVGLAVSGGGASCYGIVPLIRGLLWDNVPIDVVGGVSGGAYIGAYFCKDGIDGLDACVARAPDFRWLVYLALVTSRVIEGLVDFDLGRSSLWDLQTRLVPLATALRGDEPPEAHAIIQGTIGAAVRASGSAPLLFGPTVHGGTRYADGALVTALPARALRDYGADIVFACNAVPAPRQGKVFGCDLINNVVYDHVPFAGRLLDLWVCAGALIEEVSRDVAGDADVFVEFSQAVTPLIQSIQFSKAQEIIEEVAKSDKLIRKLQLMNQRWREFSIRGDGAVVE
jgi:NTE family protein